MIMDKKDSNNSINNLSSSIAEELEEEKLNSLATATMAYQFSMVKYISSNNSSNRRSLGSDHQAAKHSPMNNHHINVSMALNEHREEVIFNQKFEEFSELLLKLGEPTTILNRLNDYTNQLKVALSSVSVLSPHLK